MPIKTKKVLNLTRSCLCLLNTPTGDTTSNQKNLTPTTSKSIIKTAQVTPSQASPSSQRSIHLSSSTTTNLQKVRDQTLLTKNPSSMCKLLLGKQRFKMKCRGLLHHDFHPISANRMQCLTIYRHTRLMLCWIASSAVSIESYHRRHKAPKIFSQRILGWSTIFCQRLKERLWLKTWIYRFWKVTRKERYNQSFKVMSKLILILR